MYLEAFRSATKNNFVQLALEKTIRLAVELKEKTIIQEVLSRGIDIAIVGDNDFYSQRATVKNSFTIVALLSF
jgi:phosphomevalonate kinase